MLSPVKTHVSAFLPASSCLIPARPIGPRPGVSTPVTAPDTARAPPHAASPTSARNLRRPRRLRNRDVSERESVMATSEYLRKPQGVVLRTVPVFKKVITRTASRRYADPAACALSRCPPAYAAGPRHADTPDPAALLPDARPPAPAGLVSARARAALCERPQRQSAAHLVGQDSEIRL